MSSTSDSTLETLHLFRLIADVSAYIMISTGIITFIFAIKSGLLGAGYGRHYQKPKEEETKTWSKDLSNVGVLFSFKNGWIIQESGSVLSSLTVLLVCYFNFPEIFGLFTQRVYLVGAWVYLLPFYIHYVHRAWIYPCFTNSKQPISCGIMSLALLFCSWNGFQQTLSAIGNFYDPESPNVLGTENPGEINDQHNFVMPNLLGLPVFFLGMGLNLHADYHLIGLKNEGKGYQIPSAGLFKLVTCPNYFGEFVEWFGYAIFCNFSLSSIAFVVFTMGNLVPRAIKNHRWYHEKFADYPKNRKVVFPFLY